MELLTVNDMKKIQLDILRSFIWYCENNQLDYFLAAGTAIGAVRHQGFIPWDDDIDVMMPRSSYDKFLKNYINDQYEAYDCWRRDDYYYPFAKLVDRSTLLKEKTRVPTSFGVYIDIFPIDVIPESKIEILYLKFQRNLIDLKITSKVAIEKKRTIWKRLILNIADYLFRNESLLDCVREMDSLYKKYIDKQSKYMYVISFFFLDRTPMPKEVYSDFVYCIFEGIKCRLPIGNDMILRDIYGDYMKLPPIEEQVNRHDVEIYKLK